MRKLKVFKRWFKVKSLFFRLFASIMAITILILIIQIIVVSLMLHVQSKRFAEEVFITYKERLEELLAIDDTIHSENLTLEGLGPVLRSIADDRVSGLILKDLQGNIVASMGRTPYGITIGDVAASQSPSENPSVPPERDWYIRSADSLELSRTENNLSDEHIKPDIPEHPIRTRDIAGTIPLYSDSTRSELLGFVEVLVLNPFYYDMTAMFLNKMISGFGITILIALIISFLGSHTIAQIVSRQAVKIVTTLDDVAQGHYEDTSYYSTLTELKQISDSVETLKRKLSGHERMRQQWLRGIAHDLNTPLTALKLSIESALDHVVPLNTSLLERMRIEHDELEHRVAAVMTLASMESPDFRMDSTHIEVLDFVDEVISTASSSNKIILNIQVEQISGNRRLLVLIARELINNACKYGTHGTSIKWTVEYEDLSNNFIMRFRNKGFLTQQTILHVFDPWFRFDESRSHSGSGMGLAIVRQVMEAHGGNATMEQEEDEVVVLLQWPKV